MEREVGSQRTDVLSTGQDLPRVDKVLHNTIMASCVGEVRCEKETYVAVCCAG